MRKFFKLIAALAIIMAIIATAQPVAAQTPEPPTNPVPWHPMACSGEQPIVVADRANTGAGGVTVSVNDPWGCPEGLTTNQGLLYVEPWDSNGDRIKGFNALNPNAACFSATWSEAQTFGNRTGLKDGSFWIVSSKVAEHPVVVDCNDVTTSDNFGLNPGQGQIMQEREEWMKARAAELLRTAQVQGILPGEGNPIVGYCSDETYATEPLGRYLCQGVNVAVAEPAPQGEPAPEPTGPSIWDRIWSFMTSWTCFVPAAILFLGLGALALWRWRHPPTTTP